MKLKKNYCLLGCLLVMSFSVYSNSIKNILLDSEDDFLCNRANISKAKDGKGGYFCVMSANKYSELIWVPPLGNLTEFEIGLETVSVLKGYWWIKVIDAENEIFKSPSDKNINISSCTNGKKVKFNISAFSQCGQGRGKKGDGVVSYPLKRFYLIFYPRPSQPDKTIKFYLRFANGKYCSGKINTN